MTNCVSLVEIASMIQPIEGDQATGVDLRANISPTSNYQILRGVRNEARNNERAALANGEKMISNLPDWKVILETVPQMLKEESKDIEIVAWYIEALTRNYGFQGLARGMLLARQLIDAYGDQLHPHPDEDGISTQLSPLIGLNGFGGDGALIAPIKSIVMTEGDHPGPLAAWQCEQVFEIERISDPNKREARLNQGGTSRAQLDQVMLETSASFIHKLQDNISLAIEEYTFFQGTIDDYSKGDPQPTSNIMEALANCRQVLTYIAGDRLKSDTEIETEIADEQSENDADLNIALAQAYIIEDRQVALKTLRDVAAFFRRTEPHSPISYSIEQAVRWSNMPLTELIKELIPDESARTKFKDLSGIVIESTS